MKVRRYIEITRDGQSVIMDPLGVSVEVENFCECDEPGDSLTLKMVEMTKSEYKALPEFKGW